MSLRIPAGSKVLTGAPARTPSAKLVAVLTKAVSETRGVIEAHLPLCLIEGAMSEPALVLVVGVRNVSSCDALIDDLQIRINAALSQDEYLDVWPLNTDDSVLGAVRKARCQIFPPADFD